MGNVKLLRRWQIILSGTILLAILIAYIGLRIFLSSDWVLESLKSKLDDFYPGKVAVENAQIGIIGSSSLSGLQLMESGSERTWFKVSEASVDVSALGVIAGESNPNRITLKDATLTLRWDRNGNFATQFPKRKKQVESPVSYENQKVIFKNSQLVLVKAGFIAGKIEKINGTMILGPNNFTLTGFIRGPVWGNWSIKGEYDLDQHIATVDLTTEEPVSLSKGQLESLPFISDLVWEELKVKGTSTGVVTMTFNTKKGEVDYRVEVHAEDNTIELPQMKLTAAKIDQGKVIVSGRKAEIHNIQGKTLGGNLKLSGTVNFADDLRIDLPSVQLMNVPMDNVPKDWNFPLRIPGNLNAKAHVSAVQRGQNVKVQGQVDGTIKRNDSKGKADFVLKVNATDKGIDWSEADQEENKGEKSEEAQPQAYHQAVEKQKSRLVLFRQKPVALELSNALKHAFTKAIALSSVLIIQEQPEDKKANRKKPPTKSDKIDLKLKLTDVDLQEYSDLLKLPYQIKGTLSLEVDAQIPTKGYSDPKKYSATGWAKVKNLRVADFQLESVRAFVKYDQGILTLEKLDGKFPQNKGMVSGTARVELFPLGILTGKVDAKKIALTLFEPLVAVRTLEGDFSGQVTVEVPPKDFKELPSWKAKAHVFTEDSTAFGLNLKNTQVNVQLQDGNARITSLKGEVEKIAVEGTAKLELAKKYPFQGNLTVPEGKLDILQRLPESIKPSIQISGNIAGTMQTTGTLQPFQWTVGGTVKANKVQAYGTSIQQTQFRWNVEEQQLKISDLTGVFHNGKVQGNAIIPLGAKESGKISLSLNGVKMSPLVKELKLPIPLTGEMDGSLETKIFEKKPNLSREVSAKLDLTSQDLKLQGIPINKMDAALRLKKHLAEYNIQIEALKGTIGVDGKVPLKEPPQESSGSGVLKIENVALTSLWKAFATQQETMPLGGTVSLELPYQQDPKTLLPTGKGNLQIKNLQWRGKKLTEKMQADVDLKEGVLHVGKLNAKLGEGSVDGKLTLNFKAFSQSQFYFHLDGVESAKLPLLENALSGAVQLKLYGNLSETFWYGRGLICLSQGEISRLPAQRLRVPFQWRIFPASGRGKVMVPLGTVGIASGLVTVRGTLDWSRVLNLDCSVKFSKLQVGKLVRQSFSVGSLGTGKISGTLIVRGNNVRSLTDLQGSLKADFDRNQALAFPVLRRITPVIRRSPSTAFTDGDVEATFNNGVLNLKRLSLVSSNLQIFADGKVTLSKRLRLNVIAKTGPQGLPNFRLGLLTDQIPASGRIPVGILFQATEILSNQVIYLEVSGTIQNPVVRIRPIRTLGENAVRFFIKQALPTTSP